MLPAPDFRDIVEKEDAVNKDIRDALEKNYPVAVAQSAPLAKVFKGRSEIETARNIWNYLRRDIHYKKDEEGYQDIRLPRRFHYTKEGDCKSYSINALGIYSSIYPNNPVAFKYTAYDTRASEPSHVYAVVKDSRGNNIIIDGCYDKFNEEKKPTLALNLKFMQVRTLSDNVSGNMPESLKKLSRIYEALPVQDKPAFKKALIAQMELAALQAAKSGKITGITIDQCEQMHQNICNYEHTGISKKHKAPADKAAKKAKRKATGKKALHWVNVAALSIGRAATNLLIGLNLFGLATRMNDMRTHHKSNWDSFMKLWYSLGGSDKHLLKEVEKGAKKKPFFLSKKAKEKFEAKEAGRNSTGVSGAWSLEEVNEDWNSIGVAPALAALSAVPVLVPVMLKLANEFKKAGDTKNAAAMNEQIKNAQEDFGPGGVADVNANDPLLPDTPNKSDFPPGHKFGKVDDTALWNGPETFWDKVKHFFGISDDVTDDVEGASADAGIDVASDELTDLADAGLDKVNKSLQNAADVDPIWKELGSTAIDAGEMLAGSLANKVGADAKGYVNKKIGYHPGPVHPNLKPKPKAKGLPPVVYVGGALVIIGGITYLVTRKKTVVPPPVSGLAKKIFSFTK